MPLAVGVDKTFVPPDADPETRKKGFNSVLAGTHVGAATKLIEMMQAQAEKKPRLPVSLTSVCRQ